MINSRSELKNCLLAEEKLYIADASLSNRVKLRFTREYIFTIWRFVKALRHCEYHLNSGGALHRIMLACWRRKKNRLGSMLGIEIHENCFGEGLQIFHGTIVVNSLVRCGSGCRLHGMNCIGNKGEGDLRVPVLGSDIELGVGACILGPVTIADGCVIGANAVVLKSEDTEGSVLVGIPAESRGTKEQS